MPEHTFPSNRRWPCEDLLDTLVLHRLLTGHPHGARTERLAHDLAGRPPTTKEIRAVHHALARLERDGLVDLKDTTAEPSRPARRFHELMLNPDRNA